jgi:putative exosortase-associated protein (TIGR04073 family)
LCFLACAGNYPAWPASEVKTYTWQDKLKRGAINIVTSPVEIGRDIYNTTEEKNLLVGWTVGLAKGIGNGILRFGVGVIDLFTFPFGFPEGSKAPLIDPEYVWQKPGPRYI